ncbi:MAG: glutathione S-transferase [Thiobacillus sp. 65-69]|nr:glutathione S-transferase family protein [Thiobacillus sp.]ODU89675.1 MAG: glutathione S-transferase [Thiobacillus sp. SCN 65-179]OJW37603.1 MAG: glutathione S-transferase [Thiobacillus sp. 65-69]
MTRATLYHLPVCPFCQRIEIQIALKGLRERFDFHPVDISQPRPGWLLEKTQGTTALPVLETADGRIVKESLVIMQYLEDTHPDRPMAQRDPWRRAVEGMLTAMGGDFVGQGYGWLMNQDCGRRDALRDGMLRQYAQLDGFLRRHAQGDIFLFEDFGWAEAAFTPFFQRFWFLAYYEDFTLPDTPDYARVRRWIDACVAHPAAQQTSREEIVKLYYDYSQGSGNGAIPAGRNRSSMAFAPPWQNRPWPPRDKYGHHATDAELGL